MSCVGLRLVVIAGGLHVAGVVLGASRALIVLHNRILDRIVPMMFAVEIETTDPDEAWR